MKVNVHKIEVLVVDWDQNTPVKVEVKDGKD